MFGERGAARTILLNRPRALNALDLAMVRTIKPQLREWDADPAVGVLLMRGAGDRAFCAGGDVVAVVSPSQRPRCRRGAHACAVQAQSGGPDSTDGGAFARDFFREEYELDYALGRFSKPYVALMDGITMGGGVGLSVPATFRVATERSLFAMPETGIGLFPDVGGSFFLPRLQGEVGMYLAMTGARLKGEDVLKAGVATHFVPSERLPQLEDALEAVPADAGESGVGAVLERFDARSDSPGSLAPHMEAIDRCFGADSVEGMLERLEALDTEWGRKQAATMRRMSPSSMKITLRQLRLGATLTIEECFEMEYRMTQGCMVPTPSPRRGGTPLTPRGPSAATTFSKASVPCSSTGTTRRCGSRPRWRR